MLGSVALKKFLLNLNSRKKVEMIAFLRNATQTLLMVAYPSPPGRGARGVGRIKLPRIGWVKTFEILPDNVTPKSVTISRKAGRWFVSFKVETELQNTEKSEDVVGVDLGVKYLATLSTGEVFEGAKSYKKLEAELSRLQYLNRHKTKFSNNWKKASL